MQEWHRQLGLIGQIGRIILRSASAKWMDGWDKSDELDVEGGSDRVAVDAAMRNAAAAKK